MFLQKLKYFAFGGWVFVLALSSCGEALASSRIKDIADFEGVRDNPLVGYGLVVGLNGTGDNIKSIKAYKVFAVFANIAIAAWATGVLQPKLAILMRKIMHNGDNRNPAIVEQEKLMKLKAHQG